MLLRVEKKANISHAFVIRCWRKLKNECKFIYVNCLFSVFFLFFPPTPRNMFILHLIVTKENQHIYCITQNTLDCRRLISSIYKYESYSRRMEKFSVCMYFVAIHRKSSQRVFWYVCLSFSPLVFILFSFACVPLNFFFLNKFYSDL